MWLCSSILMGLSPAVRPRHCPPVPSMWPDPEGPPPSAMEQVHTLWPPYCAPPTLRGRRLLSSYPDPSQGPQTLRALARIRWSNLILPCAGGLFVSSPCGSSLQTVTAQAQLSSRRKASRSSVSKPNLKPSCLFPQRDFCSSRQWACTQQPGLPDPLPLDETRRAVAHLQGP